MVYKRIDIDTAYLNTCRNLKAQTTLYMIIQDYSRSNPVLNAESRELGGGFIKNPLDVAVPISPPWHQRPLPFHAWIYTTPIGQNGCTLHF